MHTSDMISRKALTSRIVQIIINACAIITGFCTFLPLGYVWKYFNGQCVLYADLSIAVDVEKNNTVMVDLPTSKWGTSTNCNYTMYVTVVAVIHAFVWCWFILLMKTTLKQENRDYYLLVPSFLLNSIMFIVIFISSSMISAGGDSFCHNLRRDLNSQYTCAEMFEMNWDVFSDKKKHNIFRFLLVAKICSWLMTSAILAQCVLTGFKLYKWLLQEIPDFSTPNNKQEKISKTPRNNTGFIEDSEESSSIISVSDSENGLTYNDTGSLIRSI